MYVDAFFYHQKHCNNYGYANDGDLCIKRQYQKGYGSSEWKRNDVITMSINLLTNEIHGHTMHESSKISQSILEPLNIIWRFSWK